MRTPTIFVATDGSASAGMTVRWAAGEAGRRRVKLCVVHVLDWDWNTARWDFGGEHFETARKLAEKVTAGAASDARAVAPAVEVTELTLVGNPVARLLAVADEAESVVLGGRGRGGFTGLLLGSVSQRVATHASCPVVVVRGRADAAAGPVAVGVDDSDAAEHVLAAAFAAAAGHATGLVVVRCFPAPQPLYYSDDAAQVMAPTQEMDMAERARLAEQLAPWRVRYPNVAVETIVSPDTAAGVLVGLSHSAQLVVVGSRGRGVVAGTVLGSTGLQLLHHADCPVYLDRQRKEGH